MEADYGGSKNISKDLVTNSFHRLITEISSIEDYKFISHVKGMLFGCFSENLNEETNNCEITIESFKFHGVSKDEIASGIFYF